MPATEHGENLFEVELLASIGDVNDFVRMPGFEPMRQRGGIAIEPDSSGRSPRMAWNSVDLPTPLRPTKPTRAPGTICTELPSIKSRPAIRTEMSVIESMRPCHRSGAQTQPIYR